MSELNSAPEFSYNSDYNYDEATLKQQKDIEEEVSMTQPLIGPLEDLKYLELEVAQDEKFLNKVQHLKKSYSSFRRVRGDGNCFFRAFGFACFQTFLADRTLINKFREIANKCKQTLVTLGYQECSIEDFHFIFMELLDTIEKENSLEKLLENLNDQFTSDYIVVFLRLLVSSHLQTEQEFYSNFIEGHKSVKDFCCQEVEPMNKESDQIHVIALTSCTETSVRIEYMDRSGDLSNHHDFPESSTPSIFLLYRPGHYDILSK